MLLIALASLLIAWPAGTFAQTTRCTRITSYNYGSYFWSSAPSPALRFAAADTFAIVPGLAGNSTVSLQACSGSGSPIALYASILPDNTLAFVASPSSAAAASFIRLDSFWITGFFALESVLQPGMYVHTNGALDFQVDAFDDSPALFASSASFALAAPAPAPLPRTCLQVVPVASPGLAWGLGSTQTTTSSRRASTIALGPRDTTSFMMVPSSASASSSVFYLVLCNSTSLSSSPSSPLYITSGALGIPLLTPNLANASLFSLAPSSASVAGWWALSTTTPTATLYATVVSGISLSLSPLSSSSSLSSPTTSFAFVPPLAPLPPPSSSPVSAVPPLPSSLTLLSYWDFANSDGATVVDTVSGKQAFNPLPSAVAPTRGCVLGVCAQFNGSGFFTLSPFNNENLRSATLAAWVLPQRSSPPPTASVSGVIGTTGLPYVMFPMWYSPPNCGLGLVVAQNYAALVAHAANYMPAILTYVFPSPLTDWAYFTVTLDSNSQAKLYMNGQLLGTALVPVYTMMYSTYGFGGFSHWIKYGNFTGLIDGIWLYQGTASAADVSTLYNATRANARFCFRIESLTYPSQMLSSVFFGNVSNTTNSSYLSANFSSLFPSFVNSSGTSPVDVGPSPLLGLLTSSVVDADSFRFVSGLSGQPNSISIASCTLPNTYVSLGTFVSQAGASSSAYYPLLLTNISSSGRSRSASLLAQQASFYLRTNVVAPRSLAFESALYTGYYLVSNMPRGSEGVAMSVLDLANPQAAAWTDRFPLGTAYVGTPCDGSRFYQDVFSRWSFDEGTGNVARDSSYGGNNGVLTGGSTWTKGFIGGGLAFNNPNRLSCSAGAQSLNFPRTYVPFFGSFTLSMWVLPNATSFVNPVGNTGVTGVNTQNYLTDAYHGSILGSSSAGLGIALGTNVVTVVSHTANYMPALIGWTGNLNGGWTALTVVSNNSVPMLYVNGQLVQVGFLSAYTTMISLSYFGCSYYGSFTGSLDEVRLYSRALTAREVLQQYNSDVAAAARGFLNASATCKPVTPCPAGTFQSTPPSSNSDAMCSPCPSGTFRLATWSARSACAAATVCKDFEYQAAPATATSDTVCGVRGSCPAGMYAQQQNTVTTCVNCTVCAAGTYAAALCSSDANVQCSSCTACDTSISFVSAACTSLSNTQCSPISPPCGASQYTFSLPTLTSDRVCAPCSTCSNADGFYVQQACSIRSNAICRNLTSCNLSGVYQSVAPTLTSDRTCDTLTVCSPGSQLTLDATPTSNRQCQPCVLGTSFSTSFNSPICKTVSNCSSPDNTTVYGQRIASGGAPTLTSDRVCELCNVTGAHFWSATRSAYVCVQECVAPLAEYASASPTSDRVCAEVVTSWLALDYALVASNATVAAELNASLWNMLMNQGVNIPDVYEITLEAGSVMVNFAMLSPLSAFLIRTMLASNNLAVQFNRESLTLAQSNPSLGGIKIVAASTSDSSSSALLPIVVAAVAGVMFIVVVVVLVVRRKRQARLKDQDATQGGVAQRGIFPRGLNGMGPNTENYSFTNPVYDAQGESELDYSYHSAVPFGSGKGSVGIAAFMEGSSNYYSEASGVADSAYDELPCNAYDVGNAGGESPYSELSNFDAAGRNDAAGVGSGYMDVSPVGGAVGESLPLGHEYALGDKDRTSSYGYASVVHVAGADSRGYLMPTLPPASSEDANGTYMLLANNQGQSVVDGSYMAVAGWKSSGANTGAGTSRSYAQAAPHSYSQLDQGSLPDPNVVYSVPFHGSKAAAKKESDYHDSYMSVARRPASQGGSAHGSAEESAYSEVQPVIVHAGGQGAGGWSTSYAVPLQDGAGQDQTKA